MIITRIATNATLHVVSDYLRICWLFMYMYMYIAGLWMYMHVHVLCGEAYYCEPLLL